jgi:type II secretory ATPase GspE/PulE/Tfp pilus assembly ATPase PilB-like protein
MTTAKSIEELLKDPTVLKGGQATGATTSVKKKKKSDDEETAGEELERKMKAIKIIELEQKTKSDAEQNGQEYIDLVGFPISPDALTLIAREKAQASKAITFLFLGREIRMGAIDPANPAVKELAYQLGEQNSSKTGLYRISQNSFDVAFKAYDRVPVYKEAPKGVKITSEDLAKYEGIGKDFKKLNDTIKKINITDLVTLVIAAAVQAESSDIHIEAEEKDVKIRLRVDGLLHDAAAIPKKDWQKVIARIKLLAKLKLNISDKPQDGRFSILLQEDKIDVRVSTIPIAYGESVVMRLLRSSAAGLQFADLGLVGLANKRLAEQVQRPNGMIITTGPTGSGKTTTLYAILNKLNAEDTKIITLEDPIEYKLEGINQSQIDHSKEYSFADGLRSILRQDPDIVMVGEIRDLETADVAINAALTGHLVISTIHTNSASGAIPRFLAMGVKGFLLAPAINAIMGQRLVRRVCQKCKTEYQPTAEELDKVKKILEAIPEGHQDRPDLTKLKFYEGKGCDVCNNMKYKGRVGIYEILIMNKDIEAVILSGDVSEYKMQELAVKDGMLTMAQDGLIKALQGITTIDEVLRVSE